jgi:hypothetical protein
MQALLVLLSASGAASLSAVPLIRPVATPVSAARLTRCAAAGDEEPLDPRKALEEVGDLLQQVKSLWTDGRSWSAAERDQRQRDLVTQYFRVFVPAVAFSAVQLSLSLGMFAISLAALNLSHRGYDDLSRLVQVRCCWCKAMLATAQHRLRPQHPPRRSGLVPTMTVQNKIAPFRNILIRCCLAHA